MSVSSNNSNNYLDLDDLIEELDSQSPTSCTNQSVTYNSLLNTISEIGKMADKTDRILPDKNGQDLTADLFANMSDSEMLSHFLPMKGIDFDYGDTGSATEKKKKKEKSQEEKAFMYADELMPHRMMPHLNPLYHISAFKSTVANLANQKKVDSEKDQEIISEIDFEDDDIADDQSDDFSTQSLSKNQNKKNDQSPREIKKRKPRTYKYNPKPLQHKICRSFVPDDLKDTEYWARRKRNNEAAKKSREERRKKELEILKSYEMMKQEYSQIKIENIRLKARNSMLEKQISELKCKGQ